MRFEKGGIDAAFFLFLFIVAVLGFGGSLQYPLAVLRAGAFGAGLWFLRRRGGPSAEVGPYALLVGGVVLLSAGHAFSSTYVWVSLQHALNFALASVLLAWAVLLFRRAPAEMWEATLAAVAVLASAEVGIALFQRFSGGELRPPGTFDNANYLAEFLVAASLLWFSILLWKTGSRRLRYLAGAGVGVFLAAALFLAGSRGVLVASVPAFGVLLVLRYGLRRGGALLAGVGIPALFLLGHRVVARFFEPDVYNYSRWVIWKSAVRTFLEHPFGVGLGGFQYYWFETQSPVEEAFRRYGKFAATAHNEYLEVLSGLGAAGFLLFLSVLAYPVVLAFRKRKEIPAEKVPVAAGAAGVLVLTGVHALFSSNFHVFGIFALDAVMLGALLSCLPAPRSRTFALPAWGRVAGIAGCAALLVATASTAAGTWSFDRGERLFRAGDLPGAERAFRLAAKADPFRAAYPDAISRTLYQGYVSERPGSVPQSGREAAALDESIRWEGRAASLNLRERKYFLRLSFLFAERFRAAGDPRDMESALSLASRLLEIDPYSTEAYWHRSALWASTGRLDGAMRDLERAVALEPNFCRGYAKLAEMSERTDPPSSAAWKERADACRKRAAGIPLEDYEKWLVEDPGK
jgi:O-antigen ligase